MSEFEPYEEHVDTGIPWPKSMPGHWELMRLKRACFRRNEKVHGMDTDEPYVALENIESWSGRLGVEPSDHAESTVNRFFTGDVLFGKLRPYLAKILEAKFHGVASSELLVLHPRQVTSSFLSYFLRTKEWIARVDSCTFGARMPRADWNIVGDMPQLVPPLKEQRTIAAFLDYETARIDRLIEKQQRLIELLQEKRQAVISHAVTKGLNPDAPMKESGVEWLGEVPAHWEVKRLMELTPNQRRIMYGIVLPGPHVDDGVPIVKGGDVKPGRLKLSKLSRTTKTIEAGYVRSRLREGDLVFAIRGGVGDVAVLPKELTGANLTQDAARISPLRGINPNWLLYVMQSDAVVAQYRAEITGATVTGLNIRSLKRLRVPHPPPADRFEILGYLEETVEKIDETAARVKAAVGLLVERRASLISAAVTGQIDVRNWDTSLKDNVNQTHAESEQMVAEDRSEFGQLVR